MPSDFDDEFTPRPMVERAATPEAEELERLRAELRMAEVNAKAVRLDREVLIEQLKAERATVAELERRCSAMAEEILRLKKARGK